MVTLGAKAVAEFSEALEWLYQPVSAADFPMHLFTVVSMLVPDVIMSFNEVSTRTGALRHSRNFEPARAEEWLQRLPANLQRDHPGVAYVRGGGLERVLRLSDFLSRWQLRDTALYQENYKEPGIEHQVAMVLPIPGYIAGLAVNRCVDFAEREVALLRLLSPHIVQAHANASLFSALRQLHVASPEHDDGPSTAKFTPREQEVFHWLAQGKRDREIGIILGTSHRTIQKHVQSILTKLGVETRGAAAAWTSRK